jgi:hypothetical protein
MIDLGLNSSRPVFAVTVTVLPRVAQWGTEAATSSRPPCHIGWASFVTAMTERVEEM